MEKINLKNWRALSKVEQKSINGGNYGNNCETADDCYDFTVEDDGSGCFREYSCQQSVCVPEELIC
ncbi:hypothetical protein MHM83_02465 [Tenacibaculum sp. Mcav3-52]|uniref:Uncharacterized protein n=1 Tax=Tenacibaculum singaporense TaxID=2358479 RepID=A0A3Q8RNU2_9FLAO|nr:MULTISPECIES: hypothetical protein [Tenacibaculum]AZJ34445.1 hypothetical protein D6T69_02430 [Tenacibaculum singaporense]MCG7500725.1 hypothetical protein [Tenacibaculum sp. Mcav3-52]BFF36065.1 hypothetical protein BACT7_09270 [Tenacibaculum mesophilum]